MPQHTKRRLASPFNIGVKNLVLNLNTSQSWTQPRSGLELELLLLPGVSINCGGSGARSMGSNAGSSMGWDAGKGDWGWGERGKWAIIKGVVSNSKYSWIQVNTIHLTPKRDCMINHASKNTGFHYALIKISFLD